MKKLICLIISCAILGSMAVPVSAKAGECGYSINDCRLTLSGQSNGFVTAVVAPYTVAMDTVNAEMINSRGDILYKVIKPQSGEYKDSFVLSDSLAEGRYKVHTFENNLHESFDLIKPSGNAENILNGSGTKSFDELCGMINTNKQALGLSSDFFDETYKEALKNLTGQSLSAEEFISQYAMYEGIYRVKNKSITADGYFADYRLYIDSDVKEKYEALEADEKISLSAVMAGLESEGKTVSDYFDEAFLLAKVKASENYQELKAVVEAYLASSNSDMTAYNKLADYQKDAVFVDMRESVGMINSYSELVTAFNNCVTANSQTTAGGSSSGAGSSSLGYISSGGSSTGGSAMSGSGASYIFTDIEGHWASTSINALAKSGIVSGNGDGTFRAEDSVTRAEFVTMITKAMGIASGEGNMFSDVTASEWFYGAVYGAVNKGIVNGVSDTQFMPHNNITRQDAAVMLYRASGQKYTENELSFNDKDKISDYAKEAVATLNYNGIIEGNAGNFNPLNMITRAEAAVMLHRIITMPKGVIKETSGYDNYTKSKLLIEGLTGEELLADVGEDDEISRADFLELLIKAMKKPVMEESVHEFSDVSQDAKKYVYTALNYEWLEKTPSFDPDGAITLNEALKYAVCAADAKKLAEFRGGYPGGYYETAKDAGFLKQINLSAKFTKETAFVLIYNILNAGIVNINIEGANSYSFSQSSELYMTRLYEVYKEEGVIRETSFNSFDYTALVSELDFITIGDKRIMYDGVRDDLLGYNAEVYYVDNDDVCEAVLVDLKDNAEITVDLKDASVDGKVVTYGEGNRNRTLKLESECFYVYNGRTEKSFSDELFGNNEGTVTFVDNDEDNTYDIAFVELYEYVVVGSVDREGKLVSDTNDDSLVLNLNKVVREDSIYGVEGEKQTLYNIGKGTVLEVKRSHDEALVNIWIIENNVNGAINSINRSDNTANVNGTEYEISDYFIKWYEKEVKLGAGTTITLSSDGRIICIGEGSSNESYGYAMQAIVYDDGTSGLKLLTEKNEIIKYQFADKITFDGAKISTAEGRFIENLTNRAAQLVKYTLNGEGKINMLDTSKLYDGVSDVSSFTGNDSLTQFTYEKNTMRYRSNSQTFSPYFNVSSASVFKIPQDDADDEYFEAGTNGLFINGSDYTLIAYDVDEYGNAGAVVMSYDVDNQLFGTSDASYVVEKVERGMSDGELGAYITCWSQGKYYKYYIGDEVSVNKGSGTRLESGDVARFKFRGDKIVSVCVDYYLEEGSVVANSQYSPAPFDKSDQQIGFVSGVAVNASERYASVSNTKTSATSYDTSFKALKNYSINTQYIVRYDISEKTLRPVTADEIKTYSVYTDDADYLVLRQNYDNTQLVVLYN